MKQCTYPDCNRQAIAKGLCHSHYQNQRKRDISAGIRAAHPPCKRCGADLAGSIPSKSFCTKSCKEAYYSELNKAATAQRQAGRSCVVCGADIKSRSGKAVTCSRDCGHIHQNAKRAAIKAAAWEAKKRPCPTCGTEVGRRAGSVYCSFECKHNAASARWRERSPGYMRQYLYGITPDQYAALMESQGSRCAICRTADKGRAWHLDHDHATGIVRGILCHRCNLMLGNAKDDPIRLRAAADYVSR